MDLEILCNVVLQVFGPRSASVELNLTDDETATQQLNDFEETLSDASKAWMDLLRHEDKNIGQKLESQVKQLDMITWEGALRKVCSQMEEIVRMVDAPSRWKNMAKEVIESTKNALAYMRIIRFFTFDSRSTPDEILADIGRLFRNYVNDVTEACRNFGGVILGIEGVLPCGKEDGSSASVCKSSLSVTAVARILGSKEVTGNWSTWKSILIGGAVVALGLIAIGAVAHIAAPGILVKVALAIKTLLTSDATAQGITTAVGILTAVIVTTGKSYNKASHT